MNIKPFVIIWAILCLCSCKKTSNNIVVSDKIVLATPTVSGNKITLRWSKLNNNALISYSLKRMTDTTNTQAITSINVVANDTEYTDTLTLNTYVQYYVVANIFSSASIVSNKETYARTDVDLIALTPVDALYDKVDNKICVYSTKGDIAVYDVASKKMIKQIATQANVGYCDLGIYNGKEELYVPRSDGWLFIYDVVTLNQTDQINIGSSVYSVTYNNGILFISGNNTNSNDIIFSYSRATKLMISYQNSVNNVRVKLRPGSNSAFLGLDNYDNFYACRFDNAGYFLSQRYGYLNSYTTYVSSFEIFQGGNSLISAPDGVIVDSNFNYVSSLPHGSNTLNTFAFDSSVGLIYAGTNLKAIQAYSMSNYQLTQTINTLGYPVKIFYNNDSLISVSTNISPYSTSTIYSFIEAY